MSDWNLRLLGVGNAAAVELGSAMASGTETGLYSVHRVRLSVRALRGEPSARLLRREIERIDQPLAALLIANNTFNYAGAVAITALLSSAQLGEMARPQEMRDVVERLGGEHRQRLGLDG